MTKLAVKLNLRLTATPNCRFLGSLKNQNGMTLRSYSSVPNLVLLPRFKPNGSNPYVTALLHPKFWQKLKIEKRKS